MIHIDSILAATDFSPAARNAVERAAMLAAAIPVRKGVLLHVLEEPWPGILGQFGASSSRIERRVADKALRSLDHLTEEIRQLSHFDLEPQVRIGKVLDVIIEAATDFNLLVLGARGRHPIRAFTLGTTSQRLLNKTQQSVLVVKRRPNSAYQRILVAVDFSPHSVKALAYACVVAPQADIYMTHVFEPQFEKSMVLAGITSDVVEEYREKAYQDAQTNMREFIEIAGTGSGKVFHCIERGYAPAKLRENARKWDIDLIVVGKRGKSIIEKLLLGSVTMHLLSESKCDVLVAQ